VRQSVRKLVTRGGVGNPRRNRQHRVQELPPALVLRKIMTRRCAIQQVFEVRARMPQLLLIRRPSRLANEVVRIISRRQGCHVDLKSFGDQQLRRSSRGPLSGGVRIKAEDDFRGESFQ
jgi:hypothetical protein